MCVFSIVHVAVSVSGSGSLNTVQSLVASKLLIGAQTSRLSRHWKR